MRPSDIVTRFLAALNRPFLAEDLFDAIPDTVFFIKDEAGRYVAVNQTLVARCGAASKAEIIGRRAEDVFPPPLGPRIARQDARVVDERRALSGELERHLYPGGVEGWCLTWKTPLAARDGRIVGLAGISRDLHVAAASEEATSLSRALDYVRDHLDRPLPLSELAERAGLTVFQFDQRIRAMFGLSAGQYVTRARIEHGCNRLRQTDQGIAEVALDCGYASQAAFTRQFRKTVGMTPRAYREERGR